MHPRRSFADMGDGGEAARVLAEFPRVTRVRIAKPSVAIDRARVRA